MTKPKMSTDEEPSEGGGCAGVLVLAAATIGLMGATFAISREAFIVLIVVGGWCAIVWAAGRTPSKIENHSPTGTPEVAAEEEPQVNDMVVLRDPSHPNRWLITRPSRWLDADTDKTGTSS